MPLSPYLYDFGIEVLAVVVGIIIAFQLDRWAARRRETSRASHYLTRLMEDIDEDLEMIRQVEDTARRRLGYINLIEDSLNDETVAIRDPYEYILALSQAASRMAFRPNNFTFLELQSNGDLSLLPESIRKALFEYHLRYERQSQFDSFPMFTQEEALRRFAGILNPDQMTKPFNDDRFRPGDLRTRDDFSVEEAREARQRLLSNTDAIDWLRMIRAGQVTNLGRTVSVRQQAIDLKKQLEGLAD